MEIELPNGWKRPPLIGDIVRTCYGVIEDNPLQSAVEDMFSGRHEYHGSDKSRLLPLEEHKATCKLYRSVTKVRQAPSGYLVSLDTPPILRHDKDTEYSLDWIIPVLYINEEQMKQPKFSRFDAIEE